MDGESKKDKAPINDDGDLILIAWSPVNANGDLIASAMSLWYRTRRNLRASVHEGSSIALSVTVVAHISPDCVVGDSKLRCPSLIHLQRSYT